MKKKLEKIENLKFVFLLMFLFVFPVYADSDPDPESGINSESKSKEISSILSRTAEIDNFILKALNNTKLPGLSLAIIENGQPVYMKGYGVKKVGSTDSIDKNTLFAIGSVSKSITSLLLARRIDQGNFNWDTPVKSIYPDFLIGDKEREKTLTVEQLVCNCSGFSARDLSWFLESKEKDTDKLLKTLSLMRSKYTENEKKFNYNNQFFAIAGFIADGKGSPNYKNYIDIMKNEVFFPLGMSRSTADINKAWEMDNLAIGHKMVFEGYEPSVLADMIWLREIAPAGSIFSSANDLAKYMQMELSNGKVGENTYISSENLLYRRNPQANMGKAAYGLGWGLVKHKGLDIVFHGGSTINYESLFSFIPEKKLGIIILTNGSNGSHVAEVLHNKIFELWFNTKEGKEGADKDVEKLNTPNPVEKAIKPFSELSGLYNSEAKGYPLNLLQQKSLDKILGWHTNEYGDIKIEKIANTYFFHGDIGFNIISTNKNGGANDMILYDDVKLQVRGDSLHIFKEKDEYEYIFKKRKT